MWREGYVAGGGTRFFVRELGQGDDLVLLLHGWPESGAMWDRLAPLLADAGYRVAAPDLKGFGRSDAPRDGYDPETLADETAQLIRSLHVRKAVVVGHDWGGAVALATAFRHPGRVRALATAASPYRRLDLRHAWHIPLLNVPVLPELLFRHVAEPVVRRLVRRAAAVREAFGDDRLAAYAEAVAREPAAWLTYYRRLSRRAVARSVLVRTRRRLPIVPDPGPVNRLRMPALVLWGVEDPVTPVALARGVAEDLGAELVTLPGVGHFPAEEAPLEVARELLRFVAAAGGTGSSDERSAGLGG